MLGEFASSHLQGIRRWKVKGFPNFLIFYRSTDEGVEIIRILHGARDLDAIFQEPLL